MPLEDSPSIDDFSNGLPPAKPDSVAAKKRYLLIIGLLTVVLVVMGLIGFLRSDSAALLAGKGSVAGVVLDESGNPVVTEIIVVQPRIIGNSNQDGSFLISNIPAGQRVIVIAYQGTGLEYPVLVKAGTEVSLGEVRCVVTQEPSN